MNLYVRLFWLLLTYRFKPSMKFTDALEVDLRVLPNDIDINGHVNNGRYLTLVDLAIMEMFLRSGVLLRALRLGWRPMVGGTLVSYRYGLKPFVRYKINFQLNGWDERWNYFRFEFKYQNKTAAVGMAKGAMVGSKGWIKNSEGDYQLGIARAEEQLNPVLRHWIAAETQLAQEIIK
jgi:acyl-CoA thioesterase FadM